MGPHGSRSLDLHQHPFLRGPIPSAQKKQVICPFCGTTHVLWSPTITGVLVCYICNTRLRW